MCNNCHLLSSDIRDMLREVTCWGRALSTTHEIRVTSCGIRVPPTMLAVTCVPVVGSSARSEFCGAAGNSILRDAVQLWRPVLVITLKTARFGRQARGHGKLCGTCMSRWQGKVQQKIGGGTVLEGHTCSRMDTSTCIRCTTFRSMRHQSKHISPWRKAQGVIRDATMCDTCIMNTKRVI